MAQPDTEPDGPAIPDDFDLGAIIGRVEKRILGEPKHTREDMVRLSGLTPERTQELWRALGFATVEDGTCAFTEDDLTALRAVIKLHEFTALDDGMTLAMTRVIGQTFARLASWQGQRVVEVVEAHPELLADPSGDALDGLISALLPIMRELHDYVWRRQMAVVLARLATNAVESPGVERPSVIGFVDMAGFTTLTRNASEDQLRSVLSTFERLTSDVIADHHGQVVKMIGDEVLFSCDSPTDGIEIALSLLEAAAADDVLPQVRAGLAYGPVVSRLGDVFGQTVNIASRLTTLARTDSVLVDEGMAASLAGNPALELRSLRPTSVRGYHHLKSWRVRRAG